jgi:hypothetical protein
MRCLLAALLLSLASPLLAADGFGMTFGNNTNESTGDGVVFVTCHGLPRTANGSCNAYTGDTPCETSLPLLCVNVDGRSRPAGLAVPSKGGGVMPAQFYAGWAAGRVAATPPIAGSDLLSAENAGEICRAEFGEGWRMAEFHDGRIDEAGNRGGWAWYANGRLDTSTRYWVQNNDTTANCWDGTDRQHLHIEPAAAPAPRDAVDPTSRKSRRVKVMPQK